MTKKRYKIEQDFGEAWVLIEVDNAVLTPELAVQINEFWTGADERLAATDDDDVLAVVKLAGSYFLGYVFDTNEALNKAGMQREFNESEGWPPNGGHGIRLLDYDGRPDLESCYLRLSEEPSPEASEG